MLHLCHESRAVALRNLQEIHISSVNHDSVALEYLERQVPEGLESTCEPRVPAFISFRTYINWNLDILYFNPEHMSSSTGYEFYHVDGRFYPETSVVRFIEALAENSDARTKLRYVAFYKDILRNYNSRHTNLEISSVAFEAISEYLLQMRSLSKFGVILDEECCIDQPGYHDAGDAAIVETRCGSVKPSDTVNEFGGHLITKLKAILGEVAGRTFGFAKEQHLPMFLSMEIKRQGDLRT
jgi:hypothetical protein